MWRHVKAVLHLEQGKVSKTFRYSVGYRARIGGGKDEYRLET